MSDLKGFVNNSVLPSQLKDYLLTSESIKDKLNEKIIKEIEDLYIYFNALYIFDKSEFSANVIVALKRCKNLETFYYYLKKVVDTNLERRSKDKAILTADEYSLIKNSNVKKTFKNTVIEYGNMINKVSKKETTDITEIYKLQGKIELINQLIDHPDYKDLMKGGENIIKKNLNKG